VIWARVCGDHLDTVLERASVPFESPDCDVRIRPLAERASGK
jgi:hypothetical protein